MSGRQPYTPLGDANYHPTELGGLTAPAPAPASASAYDYSSPSHSPGLAPVQSAQVYGQPAAASASYVGYHDAGYGDAGFEDESHIPLSEDKATEKDIEVNYPPPRHVTYGYVLPSNSCFCLSLSLLFSCSLGLGRGRW